MFTFTLKLVGSVDREEWTPSVTIYEEFEQVFCHVGPVGKLEDSLRELLVMHARAVAEFGVPLRLFDG